MEGTRRDSRILRWVCCLALGVLIMAPLAAQATLNLGSIEGTVKDASGAILPGASVEARNMGTGLTRTAVTDDNGNFILTAIPLGSYSVRVEMPGFKTLVREGVRVAVGATAVLPDITLAVATVEETVTVAADASMIDTARSVEAAHFNDKAIVSLPINSRDFQDFATLTPTVIRERGRDTLSMGGQKGIDTNITLDGGDFNNTFFGQATGQPEANQFVIAQEGVQEFQVLSNGYSAEIGRSGGGMLNVVTKSGTNQFHGSGFFFFRNENLSSTLDAFDGTPISKSNFNQKQVGGSFGGPIIKDKAHFFFAIEQQYFDAPFTVKFDQDVSQVPSLTTLFGGPVSGVDSLAALEGTFSRSVDLTAILGKVDIQTSDNNTLTIRYNFSRFKGDNFGASAGGIEGSVQNRSAGRTENTKDISHSVLVSNTTVFRSNIINEARFQFSHESRPRFGTNNTPPEVNIIGVGGFGRTGFLPITSTHDRYQFTDNFNYIFGNHDIKIGTDINFTDTAQVFKGFSGGVYTFDGLDNFIAGKPERFRQLVGLNGFTTTQSGQIDFGQDEYAIYIQDNWKPRPGLTINLGLRWEGLNNPSVPDTQFGNKVANPLNPGDIFGLNQTDIPDDWNNFAPRVGFAWDPNNDGKTVIRAGGGIFHSRIPLLLLANILTNNGFRQATIDLRDPTDPAFPQFPFTFPEDGVAPGDPLESKIPPPDVFFFDPNFEVPEIYRFNGGFEREIFEDFTVGVDYAYAFTVKSQRRRDINLFPPTSFDSFGRGLFKSRTSDRPDPRFRRFAFNESTANGRYNAVTFSAKKRYSQGVQFQAFYTYSVNKTEDDNERSATGIGPSQPENLAADYGNSARDIRHRFVANGLVDLPYGIQLSSTFIINSGDPFNVTSGRDDNGDGQFRDRAVITNDNIAKARAAGQDLPLGLQKRDSARQPHFVNLDFRATWGYDLERYGRVEVLFDVFNVFNNANRRTSNGRFSRSTFGLLNQIGPARQAQIGFRWRF